MLVGSDTCHTVQDPSPGVTEGAYIFSTSVSFSNIEQLAELRLSLIFPHIDTFGFVSQYVYYNIHILSFFLNSEGCINQLFITLSRTPERSFLGGKRIILASSLEAHRSEFGSLVGLASGGCWQWWSGCRG